MTGSPFRKDSPSDIIIAQPQTDDKAIAPVEERFPTAMVEGATSLPEVFRAWKERWGLEPKEVTAEQVLQRVTLVHDPLKGELTWKTENLDGLGAMLQAVEATVLMPCVITAEGALSIAQYFTQGPGRLDIGTGEAGLIIGFRDGRLVWDWQPKDVPCPKIVAKKLLAALLLSMIAEDTGLPIERILKAFGM